MAGGSHIPVLKKLLDLNTKPVLELGAGWYSTPMLFWDCLHKKIHFESYETDMEWVRQMVGMAEYVESYDLAPVDNKEWGIVFIDHAPAERRIVDIQRLIDKADYFVLHDTEPSEDDLYHYTEIYSLFKYTYTYDTHSPHTTVLSNKYQFTF